MSKISTKSDSGTLYVLITSTLGVVMARLATSRHSFNPDASSQIALIVDEVCKELAKEGTHDPHPLTIPI